MPRMAGRTLTAERIEAVRSDPGSKTTGLRDRLNAHRSGRRSGDQFLVYVFDRFVLPTLSGDVIIAAAAGTGRLDNESMGAVRLRSRMSRAIATEAARSHGECEEEG
jgi:hypothetical protein